MATLTWIPPLPPGCEARWDGNQRAYFFINHNTKQTSWTDPRPEYYASQKQGHPPANQQAAAAGHPTVNQQFQAAGHSPANHQLPTVHIKKVDGNEAKVDLQRKSLTGSGHASSEGDNLAARQLLFENTTKSLQKMFPVASYDVIRDIVEGCNNHEATAKLRLENMGYQALNIGPGLKGSTTSREKPRSASPAPTKKKISEEEKRKITLKMMAEFHDLGEDYIKMGLETVNYDDSKFRRMVELSKDSNKSSGRDTSSARKRVEDELSFKPAESLVPQTFSGGMEPVVFGNEDNDFTSTVPFGNNKDSSKQTTPKSKKDERPVKTASPRPSVSKRETSPKPNNKTSPKPNNKTSPKPKNKTSPKSSTSSPWSSPSPSHKRQPKDQDITGLHVKKVQPRTKQVTQPTYTDVVINNPNLTHAKGPDPTLRKGPNKDHLLTEYVIAKGPNPDHYSGPDTSRVHGSQGACGPDPSLVCGSQNSRNLSLVSAV